MNHDPLRATVLAVLAEIAPEADLEVIDPTVSLQEQFDLDSMDFLNVMIGLEERLGVAVPERAYPELATLDGCLAYLRAHGVDTPTSTPAVQ